jgi:hypothetical protein
MFPSLSMSQQLCVTSSSDGGRQSVLLSSSYGGHFSLAALHGEEITFQQQSIKLNTGSQKKKASKILAGQEQIDRLAGEFILAHSELESDKFH